ncbi:MAG: hypothetical protein ACLU7D_09700 [Collinsella sp.]
MQDKYPLNQFEKILRFMNKSLLLVLSALVPLSVADEVKLKDGTVYKDCTVEVETPESISVMVVVSGGIKESKTIKRS